MLPHKLRSINSYSTLHLEAHPKTSAIRATNSTASKQKKLSLKKRYKKKIKKNSWYQYQRLFLKTKKRRLRNLYRGPRLAVNIKQLYRSTASLPEIAVKKKKQQRKIHIGTDLARSARATVNCRSRDVKHRFYLQVFAKPKRLTTRRVFKIKKSTRNKKFPHVFDSYR
jgi:hypothetical protein